MDPTLLRSGRTASVVLLTLLVGASFPLRTQAADAGVVTVDTAALDRHLSDKATIEFVVLPTGEISAADGSIIATKDLNRHLKRAKAPKDAFYVFWIALPDQLPLAKAAIEQCSRYGATQFAVRQLKPRPDESPAGEPSSTASDPANRGGSTLVLVPAPNPQAHSAADSPPDFSARPESLRPPVLPRRVRCKFAPDTVVVAAAEAARRTFLSPEPPDASLLGDSMILQPGAWKHTGRVKELAATKALWSGVQLQRATLKLEGRFLADPAQVAAAVAHVRELIARDGGGAIRALTASEMDTWWTFIAFDIEEPVFILASARGKYRFVLGYNSQGRLMLLDELNALPRQ